MFSEHLEDELARSQERWDKHQAAVRKTIIDIAGFVLKHDTDLHADCGGCYDEFTKAVNDAIAPLGLKMSWSGEFREKTITLEGTSDA